MMAPPIIGPDAVPTPIATPTRLNAFPALGLETSAGRTEDLRPNHSAESALQESCSDETLDSRGEADEGAGGDKSHCADDENPFAA
jgi:hypothetical protein